MTLVPGSFFQSGSIGKDETIVLRLVDPAASASINTAFYGKDAAGKPSAATVSPDGQSVTIKVLSGTNALEFNLISPGHSDVSVQLCQRDNVFAEPLITDHTGVSTLSIRGT